MGRFSQFRASSLLLVVFAFGCSGSDNYNPELGTVTGTVTLDGKPLASAIVTFVPKANPSEKYAPASGAMTDANGKYTLRFKNGDPGALPGTHSVTISTDTEGTSDPANEKVPAKYNAESTLTAQVKLGENKIDFELQTN